MSDYAQSVQRAADHLLAHQHVTRPLTGSDGLLEALDGLEGLPLPLSALETLILPSRVKGYRPAMLDELTASGEVLWAGQGSLPGNDGWVSLQLADSADLLLPPPLETSTTPLHDADLPRA